MKPDNESRYIAGSGSKHFDGNPLLNLQFTIQEVNCCINKLNNNKACGLDQILNEFLKVSSPKIIPVFTSLSNLILQTAFVHSGLTIGVIKPNYKNEGSLDEPN